MGIEIPPSVKAAARGVSAAAIKCGFIAKPSKCAGCHRKTSTQAHHEDYTKPLDVVFLCKSCHTKRHGGNSEIFTRRARREKSAAEPTKKRVNIFISNNARSIGEMLAARQSRSFSNLIEVLILTEETRETTTQR